MKKNYFALFGLMMMIGAQAIAEESKPNFVIIMADDLGYGDLSCYGGPTPTPRLDQMAQQGLRFTDFHSNGNVCTPTRAALMTGRYQQRCGLTMVLMDEKPSIAEVGLSSSEFTLADGLKKAGYTSGIFGKWHLGYLPEHNPINHGFDEFHGFVGGCIDCQSHEHPRHPYADWWNGLNKEPEEGSSTHLITRHSLEFIKKNKSKPFFLYVPFNAVHTPFQGPDDPTEKQAKATRPVEQTYAMMTQEMDRGIGQILDLLQSEGLTENTLVLFLSDNGAHEGTPGSNGSLRGFKAENFEGGQRVPCIACWPGHIAPGTTTDQAGMTFDILPTFFELSGATLPPNRKTDGVSLVPLLLKNTPLPERNLFWADGANRAMRQGPWKLVTTKKETLLFNLQEDLGETTDLSKQNPERLQVMGKAIQDWRSEVEPKSK